MTETERAQLLINFIEVTARGLVKPYDATAIFKKLNDIDINTFSTAVILHSQNHLF